MIRKKLKENRLKKEQGFKLRGSANTRIEALSDAVFALAIALMLISSSIPETYSELVLFLEDFVPFAITITLLMLIWYEHYTFFLRYGLTDAYTVFLNTILLFLILFYVYPLKFLFKVLYKLFYGIFSGDSDRLQKLFTETLRPEDGPGLMVIYGLGASSIFLVLILLYIYAFRIRDKLELTPLEVFLTRGSIFSNVISMSIPLISVFVAYFEIGGNDSFTFAGMVYWLYAPAMPLYHWYFMKRKDKQFGLKE